jgi:hypothetical protein
MDMTDLDAPRNRKLRERFEAALTHKVAPGLPALTTDDERIFVRRRYINPYVQKRWEKFLEKNND